MSRTRQRTPILVLATIILATVITFIACAPTDASPTSTIVPTAAKTQATADPNTFHIPQQKPSSQDKTLSDQLAEYEFPTTTGVDPIIEHQLQQEIDAYKAKKTKRNTRGLTTEPQIIHIIIFAESPDDVDQHLQFMRDNGAKNIQWYKGDGTIPRAESVAGKISVDLVEQAGQLPGVDLITILTPPKPLSSLRQSNTGSADAVRIHGASTWHTAGITGNNVTICVIKEHFPN